MLIYQSISDKIWLLLQIYYNLYIKYIYNIKHTGNAMKGHTVIKTYKKYI